MVLDKLAHLDLHPGQRVVEAGTGSGYDTALLCHRAGETRVDSCESDAALAAQARHNLTATGRHPRVRAADAEDPGAYGPHRYDRAPMHRS